MDPLRVDPEVARWLGAMADSPEIAAYLLESAPFLWDALLGDAAGKLQLSEPEAKAILDACNGLHLTAALAGQHLELELQDADRLNGLGERWGVDPDFLDRIHLLSRGERWAVELWCAAFWVAGSAERFPGGRYNDPDFERAHLALLVRRGEREAPGRVGQPPRAGEPSDVELRVRLTTGERDRIRDLAERAGVTVSEYVRRMLL